MHDIIHLHRNSSVIEYTSAREIIFKLGYRMVRFKDHLHVYPGNLSYDETLVSDDLVAKFYIDEGHFSDVMTSGGNLHRYNNPWEELVDYRTMLKLVATKLIPDHTPPQSEYMGHGRKQGDLIAQYHALLDNNDLVVFHDEVHQPFGE